MNSLVGEILRSLLSRISGISQATGRSESEITIEKRNLYRLLESVILYSYADHDLLMARLSDWYQNNCLRREGYNLLGFKIVWLLSSVLNRIHMEGFKK